MRNKITDSIRLPDIKVNNIFSSGTWMRYINHKVKLLTKLINQNSLEKGDTF